MVSGIILLLIYFYYVSVVTVFTRISNGCSDLRWYKARTCGIVSFPLPHMIFLLISLALLSLEFSTGSRCLKANLHFCMFQLSSEILGKKARRGQGEARIPCSRRSLQCCFWCLRGKYDSFLYPKPTKSTFSEEEPTPPCLFFSLHWFVEHVLKRKCLSLFIWKSLFLLLTI